MGHAPDRTILVNGPDDVAALSVPDPDNLVWLSQTTLSVDETMETVRLLREKFPAIQDPPSDDICYATQNRQVAIKKVAPGADLVIVVGSANSSNSVRLVEVALEHGARAAHRVDYAEEIQQEWLDGVETVGVTSGASVPEELVAEVLEQLADAGYAAVEEVVTAHEDLMFSLPRSSAPTPRATRRARSAGVGHERRGRLVLGPASRPGEPGRRRFRCRPGGPGCVPDVGRRFRGRPASGPSRTRVRRVRARGVGQPGPRRAGTPGA